MGGGTPTVNGVVFSDVLDPGPFFDASLWAFPTGDAGLDDILDSHDNFEGPNGPYTQTLTGVDLTDPAVASAAVTAVEDLTAIENVESAVNPFVVPAGPTRRRWDEAARTLGEVTLLEPTEVERRIAMEAGA